MWLFDLFKKKSYDLDTLNGIRAIPVPSVKKQSYSTNRLEYTLQRKATEHKRNGKMDLAIECLRKSNELMPYADMSYGGNYYLRLVSYLEKAGRQDEADKLFISQQAYGKYESGTASPNPEMLSNICMELGISVNALLGANDKKSPPANEPDELDIIDNVDVPTKIIISLFEKLPDDRKDLAIRILREMSENAKEDESK